MSAKFKGCVVCGGEYAGAVCECLKGTPIYEAMKSLQDAWTKSKANDTQVGGTHYADVARGGKQHWDMMWDLYREAWFVGGITKYVLRYRKKDGLKDLRKARHYLDKLIELEELDAKLKTDGNPYEETEANRRRSEEIYEGIKTKIEVDPNPYVEINPRLKDGRLLCGCRGVKCEGHEDTNIGEAS